MYEFEKVLDVAVQRMQEEDSGLYMALRDNSHTTDGTGPLLGDHEDELLWRWQGIRRCFRYNAVWYYMVYARLYPLNLRSLTPGIQLRVLISSDRSARQSKLGDNSSAPIAASTEPRRTSSGRRSTTRYRVTAHRSNSPVDAPVIFCLLSRCCYWKQKWSRRVWIVWSSFAPF